MLFAPSLSKFKRDLTKLGLDNSQTLFEIPNFLFNLLRFYYLVREDAILDLLLSDCCDLNSNISLSDLFSFSEHCIVCFDLLFSHNISSPIDVAN